MVLVELETFGEDAAGSEKLASRRREWTDFVGGYGLPLCILPFGRYRNGAQMEDSLKHQVQAALWSPAVGSSPQSRPPA